MISAMWGFFGSSEARQVRQLLRGVGAVIRDTHHRLAKTELEHALGHGRDE